MEEETMQCNQYLWKAQDHKKLIWAANYNNSESLKMQKFQYINDLLKLNLTRPKTNSKIEVVIKILPSTRTGPETNKQKQKKLMKE